VLVTRFALQAELTGIRTEFPEYAAIHSHIRQDVLARLDRTYQAFFRRVPRGQKAGLPRFTGRERCHSVTVKEEGNGARLDNGVLVLSTIGRIAVRWTRPLEGAPKTVTVRREADGWYVAISCAEVPTRPLPALVSRRALLSAWSRLPRWPTGARSPTRASSVWPSGTCGTPSGVSRRKKGSHRRRKAVHLLARAHQRVRRARTDCQHRRCWRSSAKYDTLSHEDLQTAHLLGSIAWRSPSRTRAGVRF